jgi:hypothetical protein
MTMSTHRTADERVPTVTFSCAAVAAIGRRRAYSRHMTSSSHWARRSVIARVTAVRGTAAVGHSPGGSRRAGDRFSAGRTGSADPYPPVGLLQSCPMLSAGFSSFVSSKRPFVTSGSRPQAVLPGALGIRTSAYLRMAGFRRRVWISLWLGPAISRPCCRARKSRRVEPPSGRLPATSLGLSLARLGHKRKHRWSRRGSTQTVWLTTVLGVDPPCMHRHDLPAHRDFPESEDSCQTPMT